MSEFGARMRPLGAGKDGGRDMVCEGTLDWTGRSRRTSSLPASTSLSPAASSALDEIWTGYTVVQVKHVRHWLPSRSTTPRSCSSTSRFKTRTWRSAYATGSWQYARALHGSATSSESVT